MTRKKYHEEIEEAAKSTYPLRLTADMHHQAWLHLRREFREFFKANPDYKLPIELKKAIGWKEK